MPTHPPAYELKTSDIPAHLQAYDFNNTSPEKQKARTFTDPGF